MNGIGAWLMHLFRKPPAPEPLAAKEKFDTMSMQAQEARQYARNSLSIARERMVWWEDALSPFDEPPRQESHPQ